MPFLSVVIPAYNEQERIGSTLEALAAYFAQQTYSVEILVVDDGSKDPTASLVEQFAHQHPEFRVIANAQNRGKGAVVRQGMLAAKGQYVLFSDADLSSPIAEVERLLPHLQAGYDVAIGSRNKGGDGVKVDAQLKRKFMGRVFNSIVQAATTLEFEDTQCGFKLFTHEAAQALFSQQKLPGFSFDVEILYIAKQFHMKVIEVGVNWAHVPASKVNLIKDSARMFQDVVQIRRLHRHTRPPQTEPSVPVQV